MNRHPEIWNWRLAVVIAIEQDQKTPCGDLDMLGQAFSENMNSKIWAGSLVLDPKREVAFSTGLHYIRNYC